MYFFENHSPFRVIPRIFFVLSILCYEIALFYWNFRLFINWFILLQYPVSKALVCCGVAPKMCGSCYFPISSSRHDSILLKPPTIVTPANEQRVRMEL